MSRQKLSRPSWWPLYTLGLIIGGALFLAHSIAPSPGWRTFLDVGIVLVGFGLITRWLETHPNEMLDHSAVEIYRQAIEAAQLDLPAPSASSIQVHFYVYSDPAITYEVPEHSTNTLPVNGHHPAKTSPSRPEEEIKPSTDNRSDRGKSFFRHLIRGNY